jgi:signal transduction histidine kinase
MSPGGGRGYRVVVKESRRVSVLHRRSLIYDAVVAIGLTALGLALFLSMGPSVAGRSYTAAVLVVVHNLSLVFRRVRPIEVVIVQILTGLAVAALSFPVEVLGLGILVGTYTVSSLEGPRLSLPLLVVIEVSAFVSQQLSGQDPQPSTQIGNAIVLAVAWLLGNSINARRSYAEELERRNDELRRAHDELARAAVSEERLRIARELHDVVAHSLSMIAVQSGVGAHVIEARPDEAKHSLQVIEDASKSALVEIRKLLGILRESNGDTALDPAPRLKDIGAIVERVRNAGPEVELQVYGDISTLPLGADLAAYRIVQEALTNVVKHADSARARVVINRSPTELRVEVVDDGNGTSPSSGGQGLIGMRERVEMFGGNFEAGPMPEGGFRVDARIPVAGSS